jgi:hypothetical protein
MKNAIVAAFAVSLAVLGSACGAGAEEKLGVSHPDLRSRRHPAGNDGTPTPTPTPNPPPTPALPWTFTKTVAGSQQLTIGSPAAGVHASDFDVGVTSGPADTTLTALSLQLMGNYTVVPEGSLSNFRVVYFPNGRSQEGVVVATSPASSTGMLDVPFSTPVAVGSRFTGAFSVLMDVAGTPPFFFTVQLQNAFYASGGVEKYVDAWLTCDLPLGGDSYTTQ